MATNVLTDSKIRSLKPADKIVKAFDGAGLFLAVLPSGTKAWRLAYRHAGKQLTMSFGQYPEVGLAEARQRRDEARRTLRDGDNPMAERKAARNPVTFRQGMQRYWAGRKDLSEKYITNATRAMEMHVLPHIGDVPIADLTRADLMATFGVMNDAGLYEYVRKTRMWVGLVLSWAVEQGLCEVNHCSTIKPERAFGKSRVQHFAALDLPEVRHFWTHPTMQEGNQSVLACRLLAYTWVRTGELRLARWSELDGDVWRIPAARMKMDRDHLVPLSEQALELFEELRSRKRSDYIFPHETRDDRPMSENAVLALIARMGFKGKMTGHGWRSVGSTWANEKGYSKDAIERQLAHAPEDRVRATYNRAEFLPERRRMLQDFAGWLGSL